MSNVENIQISFLLMLPFSFIVYYLIHKGRKQIEEKQKYSVFLAGKSGTKGTTLYKLYEFFSQWPVTKRYIGMITKQFEIIMPGDKKRISKESIKTAIKIWILDIIIFILLFALKPSYYRAIITITYIYIINNQSLWLIIEKYESNLLKQFDKLIGDVRHRYQIHHMADEAIYEANENAQYPINLHITKIHEILDSNNIEDEVNKYKETMPNRFLKTFLALSVMVIRHGDKKIDNQFLYLTNQKYLKQEVNIEITRRNRVEFLFSGLIFIAVTPILTLKSIQDWAIGCFTGLQDYYYGAFGITTTAAIFVSTIAAYNIINRLKETYTIEVKNYTVLEWISNKAFIKTILNNILNKNYGRTLKIQDLLKKSGETITTKQFLLKRILYGIVIFICCIMISFVIHGNKKIKLLTNADNIDYLSSMVTDEQESNIKEIILKYVNEYKQKNISVEALDDHLFKEGVIKSKELATMTAEEIVNRVNSYQNQYYKWYELIVAFLGSLIAFYIPYYYLVILKKVRQMTMEDEVIQFHSIILMLMYMDRMTVATVLEWMENFAVVFKKSIRECINDLQGGEEEALEELIKKEPYEPFVRLVENLQNCDKLPIEEAFDEIASERFNYQESRRLEDEIYTNKKTIWATILAWTPAAITIGLYLIIPLLVEAFVNLFSYLGQMNDMI